MPMLPLARFLRPLAVLLAAASASAWAQGTVGKSIIVLDPAHGGADSGAHLPGDLLEKEITFALAAKLRKLLAERGFTVVLTREGDTDSAVTVSNDQRAEIANHAHPLACLLLHASNGGHGVHLFTSALMPLTLVDEPRAVLAWDSAQAASIPQSLRLVNELAASFNSARVPLVVGRASIHPIDSLICPAIALEMAPLVVDAATTKAVSDEAYQQNVAEAIANGLLSWRGHAEETAGTEVPPAKTVVKPPVKIPVESAKPPAPVKAPSPPKPKAVTPKPSAEPDTNAPAAAPTPKAEPKPDAKPAPALDPGAAQ